MPKQPLITPALFAFFEDLAHQPETPLDLELLVEGHQPGGILATAIKSTHPWGTVTCCGNVASPDLPLTVFPFILRGVRLIGIDSQNCPMGVRLKVWEHLASDWKIAGLHELCKEITLDGLSDNIDLILKGQQN